MSNPVKELAKTCEILGKECKDLFQEHTDKKIDEITFINKYFDMVDKLPPNDKKNQVVKELEKFMTSEKEVSFRDEPTESEVKSE